MLELIEFSSPLADRQRRPTAVDGKPLDRHAFGGKAAELARLVANGGNVPTAFALSARCVAQISSGPMIGSLRHRLYSALQKVLQSSPASSAIVRSSHALECDGDTMWNGRFSSEARITDFDALLKAIGEVARSDSLRPTHSSTGANPSLAVIVQSEIPCDYSALVLLLYDGVRIELFRGGLAEPINGHGTPTVVVARRALSSPGCLHSLRVEGDDQRLGARAIELARSLLRHIPPVEDFSLLEAGCHEGTWHLFQQQSLSTGARAIEPGPADARKAASMLKFKELGLFGKELAVWSAGRSDTIDAQAWRFPLTVRFAKGEMLGLPRFFVRSETELAAALSVREPSWNVIIHEFIEVTRSFELLIDEEQAYLEHLPGIWESESVETPDALMIGKTGACRSFRRRDERACRDGRSPSGERIVAPPVSADLPVRWAERLSGLLPRLRSGFSESLPVNLHFVEDSRGEWHFLNSRCGFDMPQPAGARPPNPWRVKALADLDEWDGCKPLILAVTTGRGEEYRLDSLAERLKDVRVPIYAEFGLLSHPAMALQARGVALLPAYGLGGGLGNGEHEVTDFQLDQGSDPVRRIAGEQAVYADERIRVVNDRDQIVPGHLLVVAQQKISSFATASDCVYSMLVRLSEDKACRASGAEDWLVYERGNARFCTSGFTGSHAHMHLLPLVAFEDHVLRSLSVALGARPLPSLTSAWAEAGAIAGEYLIFGTLKGGGYLCQGLDRLEKQFVRRFLASHRK